MSTVWFRELPFLRRSVFIRPSSKTGLRREAATAKQREGLPRVRMAFLLGLAVLCGFSAVRQAYAQNLSTFAGTTAVGSSSGALTVTLTAQAAGTVNTLKVLTLGQPNLGQPNLGQPNLDFVNQGTDPCTGANLSVGGTCQVAVIFSPRYPGVRSGAVVLLDSSNNVLATQYLLGTGEGALGVMVPGTMETAVGNGQWTAVNDGDPATGTGADVANLYLPSGVAVDGAGDIFIADSNHNRIREVFASGPDKGLIETICNVNGVANSTGDGGLAVNATLNNPRSVALDGAGNIYIADSGNNVIREINASTGIITTIAGNGTAGYNGDGAGTATELNGPFGITVDASGNVYIADTANQRIREFVAATATINTVAGKGDTGSNGAGAFSGDGGSPLKADLSLPYAIAFDAAGNMYIPDSGNNRIRIIYATGAQAGTINTFAGNGNPTFAGDGGPAASASFYAPSGVAVDVAGNLYIADTQNNRIRKVSESTGEVSTVAGNGDGSGFSGDGGSAAEAGLFGPYGIFLDSAGDLFIADYFDHRIREVQSNVALLTFTPAIREGEVSLPQLQVIENDGNASLSFASITHDSNAVINGATTTCSTTATLLVDGTCNVGAEFAPTEVGDPVIGNILLAGNPADSPLDIQVSDQALALTSTNTTLSATTNPAVYGARVTLSASVNTGTGTLSGNVTFMDGSTTLGTSALNASDTTGSATFTTSTLAVGAHQLTAVYDGDGVHGTSTSPTYTENIQEPTSVTVSSSLNPSVSGDSVTFTATVTAAADGGTAPTGTVIFSDGTTVLGSATLSGNTAALTLSSLSIKTHSITAAYGGDAENAASTSAVLSQVVNATASQTGVSSSLNPSIAGQSVTLTVTVTGISATPTGSVTLKDGAATLATLPLGTGGTVAYTTSALAAGTHSITAVYAGDANNAGSTSAVYSQVVNLATTNTGVSAGTNPATAGKSVSFTATVSSNGVTPTGTMKFYSQGNLLGSATLNGSAIATYSTSTLAVGADSITAVYSGDAKNAGSTSPVYLLSVVQASTSVNLVSSLNPATAAKTVTFTATVTGTGGTPTGQVIFSDGATPLGTVSLNGSGIANYSTTSLSVGQHSITAAYQGDANDGTASAGLTETIQQASPSISVSSNLNPSSVGASVTLTANLNGAAGTPSGSVTFQDGGTIIGTMNIAANGTAAFGTSALALGQHSIKVSYSGDNNNAAAKSAALTQTVQETTTTMLGSSSNPSIGGTPVTFTAAVTGSSQGTVTGTVTFKNGVTTLGSVTLNSAAVAAYTISSLPVGADSINAVYSGDTLDAVSTSAPLTQTVQSAATATTLISSDNPSLFGANVTFTATVTGNGIVPTGTVTFTDGTTQVGTANLGANGVATYSTAALVAGIHPIVASYSGDKDNLKSASALLNQQVQAHTVVTVASSLNPALAAAQVTFTATVANGTNVQPTGTITLNDGSTELAQFTVPGNGTVTYSTSSLVVGQHPITAVYSGDTDNTAATSAALTQIIQAIPTKTTLGASALSLNTDQQLSLLASVFSAGTVPLTGTVTFQNGSTVIGSTTMTGSGTASLTPTLAAGSYNIVAVYSGDANNASSTSSPVPVTITLANDFQLSLNPSSVTMATKQYSTVTLTFTSTDGFTDQLGLGCGSLPASVTCNFSSPTVTLPANGTVTAQVTIDTASPLTSGGQAKNMAPGGPSSTTVTAWLFPGSALFGFFWWRSRKKFGTLFCTLLLIVLSGAAFTISGCGGLTDSSAQPGTYTVQVTANGVKTGVNHAVNVTVTVTP